ncbi:glycosyltransferase family 2 protein [Clostridium pasteurianum]|uniref:Glycosyl transferase n=1 Tax=Clostridium pasteurianum BC1 TaxID=86416 RepID=R4K286_CLOPA|nr:glycosyltransferase family A protein [Clostridium pasteurianum]AGK95866.1 glycosyl transferase [Clostridium pasteurianum BC1]
MGYLVSVIIPVYNSEKYIEDTIKSILNQTYDDIEIITIDDGSSDESAKVIKELISIYKGKKTIKYYYQENSGVSIARNSGIEKATGKYIAFMDSDDLWKDTKIEAQMKMIEKTSMKACYCGFLDFFQEDNLTKKRKMKLLSGRILYDFLKDDVICWTGTWVMEKSLVDKNNIRFTENCNWGEDLEFFFKIAAITEVCCVGEYLALYRIRPNSLTTSSSFLKRSEDIHVLINLDKWMKQNADKLIYKNIDKISNLIYQFRIPFSLINYTYAYINTSSNEDIHKNFNSVYEKLYTNHMKNLSLINGLKSLKLYVKLYLMRFRLYKYRPRKNLE